MKEQPGTFTVEKVNDKPILEAIAEAIQKATENKDEALVAELTAMKDVDWSKVPFTFKEYADESEYSLVWSKADILKLVNKAEETREKSKAYQKATKALRPDPKSPEVKREGMIKTLIDTFNYSRQAAEAAVDVLIAQGKA